MDRLTEVDDSHENVENRVEMLVENILMWVGEEIGFPSEEEMDQLQAKVRYGIQQCVLGCLEDTSCEKDLYDKIEKSFSEWGVCPHQVD